MPDIYRAGDLYVLPSHVEPYGLVLMEALACGTPAVAGNVGGGGRQSYSVYGDTVNVAARLEALCKDHDTSLLLSATTAKALPHEELVETGDIAIRGHKEPVTVFSIRDKDG